MFIFSFLLYKMVCFGYKASCQLMCFWVLDHKSLNSVNFLFLKLGVQSILGSKYLKISTSKSLKKWFEYCGY